MPKTFTDLTRHALNGPTMGTRWSALFHAPADFDAEPARLAMANAVTEVDGHDLGALEAALQKPAVAGKPSLLLAKTVKGKGVSFMENQVGWHGKAPNQDERVAALRELEG